MVTDYRCWAEVDLEALRENLAWIRHRIGPGVKVLTVVKADAYGHGLRQIAALLMQSGTDVFGVANLAEARAIRRVGKGWPILMLGACLPNEVANAVRDEVMPVISTLAEARRFSSEAVAQRKTVSVHLKVDTGMGRLGSPPGQAVRLAAALARLPGLALAGACTHFAAAEDDASFTREQLAGFTGVVTALERRGLRPPLLHASSSAGLLHEPEGLFNLVRPGLIAYGIAPAGQRFSPSQLPDQVRPALSWYCRVSLVKTVPAGLSLSYGRTYVTPRRMRVATLTAGYGDGFLRAGSNRAMVLVGGRRCPVLGRVTMDQMLVDVSSVRGVRPGDPVVLIGRQGRESISAGELAGWGETVAWEVLTNISYRVPRLYLGGTAA
ncbi:MAG: alanine racemase [Limisphaerales bacterium]